MIGSLDYISGGSYETYLAAQMWKTATWIPVMAESFKGADHDRNYFAQNGTWLGRTGNIHRYIINIYA